MFPKIIPDNTKDNNMPIESKLKGFICAYLNELGLRYCDWEISSILRYVIMNEEAFNYSNPQSHISLDTIDKIYEQDIWNLSLHIRNVIKNLEKLKLR